MKYKIATSLDVFFNDNFEEIRAGFAAAVADEAADRIYSAGIELMVAYTIRIELIKHSLEDHLADLSKVLTALRGAAGEEE